MPRIFAIPWNGTITNSGGNTDLWEILPADDQPVKIIGFRLGQSTEEGDATAESVRVCIRRFRATVTSGSGGSAGAPEEVSRSNQAPAFASEVNNTTVATTSGDNEILDNMSWMIQQSPYEWYAPDDRFAPAAIQGEALIIRLEDTVVDDITFDGCLWVEEGP